LTKGGGRLTKSGGKGRLEAVTFDFWSTLVDGQITPQRTAERLTRLHAALVGAGHACSPEALRRAFAQAIERAYSEARETLRDVGVVDRLRLERARPAHLPAHAGRAGRRAARAGAGRGRSGGAGRGGCATGGCACGHLRAERRVERDAGGAGGA